MRGVVGSGEPAIVIDRNSTFRSGPQRGKMETETNRIVSSFFLVVLLPIIERLLYSVLSREARFFVPRYGR